NLAQFKHHLSQLATTQLAEIDLHPQLDIDAEVTLPELGGDTFQATRQLAPFGRGNPVPIFVSRRVEVVNCRTMGKNNEHLRIKLKQGNNIWNGVGFRLGNYLDEVSSPLDIVYNLEIDHWRGEERLRLNILDFASTTLTFTTST
ncbi:single-stranded-DNA-specific exonuclease RecJ, partial [Chloroflexota bacterium]